MGIIARNCLIFQAPGNWKRALKVKNLANHFRFVLLQISLMITEFQVTIKAFDPEEDL